MEIHFYDLKKDSKQEHLDIKTFYSKDVIVILLFTISSIPQFIA